jgi:hypothetical protein
MRVIFLFCLYWTVSEQIDGGTFAVSERVVILQRPPTRDEVAARFGELSGTIVFGALMWAVCWAIRNRGLRQPLFPLSGFIT